MQPQLKTREMDRANEQPAPAKWDQPPADIRQNPNDTVHLSVWRNAKQPQSKDTTMGGIGLWILLLIFLASVIYVALGGSFEATTIEMGSETMVVPVYRPNTAAAAREEDGSGPHP